MKRLLAIAIICLSVNSANAQQEPMFTHYMFNTMAVNPAYAGNRGMLTATLLHRSQWVGFEGAPMTQTLTINSPIYRNSLAVGVSLTNDKIGPTNIFTGNVDLAYILKLNKKNRLAFGLKGAMTNMNRGLSSLVSTEQGDYAIDNASRNDMSFDFGFGFLYTNDHFYLGASTPKVVLNNFADNSNASDPLGADQIQNFYLTAGGIIDLGTKTEWKPSTFVRATHGAPVTIDLTNMFVFNKKFEIGAMYRYNDGAGLLVGYTFKEALRIGYSFDFSIGNRTVDYNYGSHEIMLRYDLFLRGSKEEIISPRYF